MDGRGEVADAPRKEDELKKGIESERPKTAAGGASAGASGAAEGMAASAIRLPKKKIEAKAAAMKRKAREAKAKVKKEGSGSYFPSVIAAISIITVVLYRSFIPDHTPISPASVTADRIELTDGRYLAVHETGAAVETARYHVLVLHDLKGCRLSMLPNVTKEYLIENSIRLVSYDRPGYGQSDVNAARTAAVDANDIRIAADQLKLPQKFYVVSLGVGSYVAWALMRAIPDRLAGVALVSPWGSFRMKSLKSEELIEAWNSMPRTERVDHLAARLGPWGVSVWYAATETFGKVSNQELPSWATMKDPVPEWLDEYLPHWTIEAAKSTLAVAGVAKKDGLSPSPEDIGSRDLAILKSPAVENYRKTMEKEALQQGVGESEYRDMAAVSSHWGFDLADVKATLENAEVNFKGKVHVWFGSEDRIMPATLAKHALRVVPFVEVHEVEGAGHYFYFESEEWPKKVLNDLLGLNPGQEIDASAQEAASAVYA